MWSDESHAMIENPEKAIKEYCTKTKTSSCNVVTNAKGVMYLKSISAAHRFDDANPTGSKRKALHYFILNKNTTFPIISLSNEDFSDKTPLEDYEALFDHILSTFEFLEKDEAPNTSTWETYTNDKYKFAVKYPSTVSVSNGSGSDKDLRNTLFNNVSGGPGLPDFWISIQPYTNNTREIVGIYNSLPQSIIDKIFSLKVGAALDQETTDKIVGTREVKEQFKRLPDEVTGSARFLVIEIPHRSSYGSAESVFYERRLFLKEGNQILQVGVNYIKDEQLETFKQFIATLQFLE